MKKMVQGLGLVSVCGLLLGGCTSPYLAAANKGDKVAQFKEGLVFACGPYEHKKFSESDTAAELQRVSQYRTASYFYKDVFGVTHEFGIDRPYVITTLGKSEHYSGTSDWYPKAFNWFTQSAEQGYAPAMFHLGLMYEFGRGVSADKQKSNEWMRKAAEKGYEPAQKYLSGTY